MYVYIDPTKIFQDVIYDDVWLGACYIYNMICPVVLSTSSKAATDVHAAAEWGCAWLRTSTYTTRFGQRGDEIPPKKYWRTPLEKLGFVLDYWILLVFLNLWSIYICIIYVYIYIRRLYIYIYTYITYIYMYIYIYTVSILGPHRRYYLRVNHPTYPKGPNVPEIQDQIYQMANGTWFLDPVFLWHNRTQLLQPSAW